MLKARANVQTELALTRGHLKAAEKVESGLLGLYLVTIHQQNAKLCNG